MLPLHLIQAHVLPFFSSLEMFKLRLVSVNWAEAVKSTWCHAAKQEMLGHLQSLDLLYEKESVAKIMDFKLSYIMACGEVMGNYFYQLPMKDILKVLVSTENAGAKRLVLIVAFLVDCSAVSIDAATAEVPFEDVREEQYVEALEFLNSERFMEKYLESCKLDSIPVGVSPSTFASIKESLMSQIEFGSLINSEQYFHSQKGCID